MSEMKHTPTPWQIHRDAHDKWYKRRVYGGENTLVANILDYPAGEANAELIVRAVNSHHDLLEAAIKALAEMRNTVAPRSSFTDAVDALDAAITKAKGKNHD